MTEQCMDLRRCNWVVVRTTAQANIRRGLERGGVFLINQNQKKRKCAEIKYREKERGSESKGDKERLKITAQISRRGWPNQPARHTKNRHNIFMKIGINNNGFCSHTLSTFNTHSTHQHRASIILSCLLSLCCLLLAYIFIKTCTKIYRDAECAASKI